MKRVPMRQGDVVLVPIESIPDGLKKAKRDERGRLVLALGEVTGHAHCVLDDAATMFLADDLDELADRFLRVEQEAAVVHDEHDTLVVPAGDWVARVKREYAPERPRQVMD